MTTNAFPMMLAELIPAHLFTERSELWLWGFAIAAIPMLVLGAGRLVDAAVHLARAIGMSTVLIGATVVSLGTTSPEAVVSVRAALAGHPELALGNAVGSVICDTALIFGLCCILTRLPANRFILNRHGWLQLGSGILLMLTALGLWLGSGDINNVWIPRWVGLVYLALLAAYMCVSVRWARRHPEIIPDEAEIAPIADHAAIKTTGHVVMLVFGLALVVLGSEFLIGSVTEICHRRNVPEAVIAVTLVAFGTSLPELVTAVASIAKGHSELLIGNIIGADILNILFVIGASASAVPLRVEPMFFQFLLPVMILVLVLLRVFIFMNDTQFKRWQGIPLLLLYALFVTISVAVFGAAAH